MCFVCASVELRGQTALTTSTPKPGEAFLPFKKCWEYPVENIGRLSVSVSNGTVYVAEAEGRVRALNVRSGTVTWVTDLGGTVSALYAVPNIGVAAFTTVAAGSKRSTLRLLNAGSGLVRYSMVIDIGADIWLTSDGSVLMISDPNGTIVALNLQDGTVIWQIKLPEGISAAPANFNGNLVVATDDNKLNIFVAADGNRISTIPTDRSVKALWIRENGMIVAGDDRGRVTNYRDNSGAVWWKFKSGARVGTISETDEGLLIGSYDNFLYLVSKYTGDVKWKRRLDGRILFRPAVIGNRIIAASSTEETAQVIELETGKAIDRVAFGENRSMLMQPYISERSTLIFAIVDGLMAFAPGGCTEQ